MSGTLSGLVAVLLWGAAPVTLKLLVVALPGALASTATYAVASLLSLPWLLHAVRQGGVSLRTWVHLVVIGLMLTSAFNLLVSLAAPGVRGTTIGAIVALEPLMVALFSAMLLRRWPSLVTQAALLLSLVGVWLLTIPSADVPVTSTSDAAWAISLVVLGAALWSLGVVLATRIVTPWGPLQTSMVMIGTGSLPFLLAVPFHSSWSSVEWSTDVIAGLVFMALGATLLANILWLRALRVLGTISTSLMINLIPLTTVALSILWLGESWDKRQMAGAALVLSGLSVPTLLNFANRVRRQPSTRP